MQKEAAKEINTKILCIEIQQVWHTKFMITWATETVKKKSLEENVEAKPANYSVDIV
jgi:hypothetical protein